jgi:hypothetical protein
MTETRRSILVALFSITCLAAACSGEDIVAADTELQHDTTTSPEETSSTGSDASSDATGTGGSDDSGSEADEGSFIDGPDAGTGVEGIGYCVGFSQIGHLATVHANQGASIEPTCDATPAHCGGDLVGSWTIEADCGLEQFPNFFADSCPSSTMDVLGSDVQGTRTFDDDLTFERDVSLSFDVDVTIDAVDCFGIDCATLGQVLDLEPELSAVCVDMDDTCGCLITVSETSLLQGTYEVVDDGVIVTVDGGKSDPMPFCVTDERLDFWEPMVASNAYQDTPCRDAQDCVDALGDAEDTWICADQQ